MNTLLRRLSWTRSRTKICLLGLLSVFLLSCSQEQLKSIRLPSQKSAAVSSEVGTGGLYALVVGISTYRHNKIPKLRLADKDARDFAAFLKTQDKLFRNIDVSLLVNEEATEREIRKYLDYKLSRATKDDTVIVFFSGHGATDPRMPGDSFFVTYDAEADYLASTAVNVSQSKFLKRLAAKRAVLFADTCHAGGFSDLGTKSIESPLAALARQIKESEGKVLLASSRDDEVSIEKPGLPNGVFTHYLLQGLKGEAAGKDGIVTLKDLYDFVHKKTVQETGGIQHPRMVGDLEGPFPISLVRVEPSRTPVTQPSGPATVVTSQPSELDRLRSQAEAGDAKAQYELGRKYELGTDTPQDKELALLWYGRAKAKGNKNAEQELARLQPGPRVTREASHGIRPAKPAESAGAKPTAEPQAKVVMISSRSDEISMQKKGLPNSVFAYHLLKGLRGAAADKEGVITLKALYDHVYSKTREESVGNQHPQLEGTMAGPFPLALISEKAVSAASPGIESKHAAAGAGMGQLYAIVVGVGRYGNPKIPQLNTPNNDARAFADFLKTQRRLFKDVYIDLLENEHATKRNVEERLYYGLRRAGKDDTVILFFTGHGTVDSKRAGEFFFLTYDSDLENLAGTGVQMTRLQFLERLDSRKVLLIADICHAGHFSGQEKQKRTDFSQEDARTLLKEEEKEKQKRHQRQEMLKAMPDRLM